MKRDRSVGMREQNPQDFDRLPSEQADAQRDRFRR
jgi:hypothetical protein